MKSLKDILFSVVFAAMIVILSCVVANAAPIENYEMELTQPNGTQLNCYVSGDEYFNYLHDARGNIIIQHPETGYYVYAEIDKNGKLVASGNIALNHDYDNGYHSDGAAPMGSDGVTLEDIDFSINADLVWRAEEENTTPPVAVQDNVDSPKSIGMIRSKPIEGKMENIIVMICFSDENPQISSVIKNKIETVFNASSYSLKDYLKTVSQGVLEVDSTLVGMNGDTVLMYQDTHPRSYYCPYNEVTNPDGYQGGDNGTERRQREHELLKNAINAINGSSLLEGKNLDIMGDGYVDSIAFIVSGNVGNWNSLLWPHKWSLYSTTVKLNGKRVYSYSFQLADYTFPQNGSTDLSVICHETLHVFGLPDLYRYSYSGTPVGAWDIMASNDKTYPQFPSSHSLLRYAGWGNPLVEITGNGNYTLNPVGDTNGITAYAIKTSNPKEFILLEYRSENNDSNYNKSYKHNAYSYKAGLTITRINTVSVGNSSGSDEEVYVYRPNESGYNSGQGSISLASLSQNAGRSYFGKNAIAAGYSGSIYLNDGTNTRYVISNVSELGDTLSFDINIEEDTDITDRFPDDNFLQEIRTITGKTDGEPIFKSDVMNITRLDIEDKNIQSLDGIEYFTGLKELYCYVNEFETLDLSNNTRLEILDCSYNMNLVSLNVSQNTVLKELHCNYAQLTSLDVSNNRKLTKLICYYNQLHQLDITNNRMLNELDCSKNYLNTLDVTNNKKLTKLKCTNNLIISLDDVIGWQEIGLVLDQTLKYSPQRNITSHSLVHDNSHIYPIYTTYVSQHDDDKYKNYYGDGVLKVNYTAKENNANYWGEYSYLKFDVSNVPKEWVKSAKLRLYVENGYDYRKSVREIGVYDTHVSDWDASTMTWDEGRVDARSLLSSFTVTATGYSIEDVGWHEVDITDYIKNNCIDDELSLMLKSVSTLAYETIITSIGTTDTSDNVPVLVLEYNAEADIMPVRTCYVPSTDTYTYQHEPNNKYSDSEFLSVNYTDDASRTDYWGQDAYLSFNIGDMTADERKNIKRAVLWMYIDETSDNRNSTRSINISANDGLYYSNDTLSWSSGRLVGNINIGDFTVRGNGYKVLDPGWRKIDITNFIKSTANSDIEFIINMTSEQAHPVIIRSKEHPLIKTQPRIIIESETLFIDISDNYVTEISQYGHPMYKFIPKRQHNFIFSFNENTVLSAMLLDENLNELAVSNDTDGVSKLIYDLDKDRKYYLNVVPSTVTENECKLYIETPLKITIE